MIKPASSSCNMQCRYCFYTDISRNRDVKSHGIMSLDILEKIVHNALSEAESYCTFIFQGGEPTLASLDFFKKLIEYEIKYNINQVKISHAIQTNGLLIDEKWAEFFKENNFLVGLSIDADKQLHDFLRLDTTGKGTHNRCMNVARLLTKSKVDYNILSVITRQLASHPERIYRFYKQNNFRYIQFIPCLENFSVGDKLSVHNLSSKKYGTFLCSLFDLWYADYTNGDYFSIRCFDNYIQMLAGYPPESCAMNGVCTAYILIEADGSVYPCDFYALDEFLLGNVITHSFGDMLGSEKAETFVATSEFVDDACKSCEFYFLCRGGCRRNREPVTDGHLLLNRFCEAYKTFFIYAMPRMTSIAENLRRRKA